MDRLMLLVRRIHHYRLLMATGWLLGVVVGLLVLVPVRVHLARGGGDGPGLAVSSLSSLVFWGPTVLVSVILAGLVTQDHRRVVATTAAFHLAYVSVCSIGVAEWSLLGPVGAGLVMVYSLGTTVAAAGLAFVITVVIRLVVVEVHSHYASLCPRCAYQLTDTQRRCPECGDDLAARAPPTSRFQPGEQRRWRLAWFTMVLLLVAAVYASRLPGTRLLRVAATQGWSAGSGQAYLLRGNPGIDRRPTVFAIMPFPHRLDYGLLVVRSSSDSSAPPQIQLQWSYWTAGLQCFAPTSPNVVSNLSESQYEQILAGGLSTEAADHMIERLLDTGWTTPVVAGGVVPGGLTAIWLEPADLDLE